MSITLRRLSTREFAIAAPQLVHIYIAAMGYSPDSHPDRLLAWRRDMLRPGFSSIIATTQNSAIAVAYGFLGSRETWWDRQVRSGLTEAFSAEHADAVLKDYFELAEIHVWPGAQGRGIGGRLLRELLWNIPASSVLLSTPEVPGEDNGAFRLYRSFDFKDVLRNFGFLGDPRPFAILGRPLPFRG